MADPRVQKLAQVIIRYSLGIRRGERLMVLATLPGLPLVVEVYREAIRAGALPEVRFSVDALIEINLREGNEDQLRYQSVLHERDVEHIDAFLQIRAEDNTKSLNGVDPRPMALFQEAQAPLFERFAQREAAGELRWCLALFPTRAYAQEAGMSLAEYEDLVYRADLLDSDDPAAEWDRVRAEQQRIVEFFSGHDEIRILGPGTDLRYRTRGRTWINASGKINLPDGEVYTAPIENSVSGAVAFTYPVGYQGRVVEGVRLTFRDGRVEEAKAERGEDFLLSMLDLDQGARFVGEVAFGLNRGIRQFTNNTLFDEKICGTMHIALGRSLEGTGGENESALHWDMVSDLGEAEVFADGELCCRGGRFII